MPASRKPERIRPLARAVLRVSEADRRLRLTAAERLGVGPSDFDALLLIDTTGPLAAGRIAEALAITTGAVTGLIDRLERAGWVQRTRGEADRRQVLIELAPARRDAVDAHWAERERMVREAVSDLGRGSGPAGSAAEGQRGSLDGRGAEAHPIDDAALATLAHLLDAVADRMAAGGAEGADAADAAPDDGGDGDRAPLGALERGRLRFSGSTRLVLRGARIKDLYRATFRGRRPQIAVEADGTVAMQYKALSWLGARDTGAELILTTAVPWAIELRRGASHLAADLRELQISALEITGGVSESELSLPRPRGTSTLRITGGASQLAVKRPRGTAAQVVVRGGASNFVFDAQRLGAVGSTTRLATPGWDSATDRWSIELTGGASELAVTEL